MKKGEIKVKRVHKNYKLKYNPQVFADHYNVNQFTKPFIIKYMCSIGKTNLNRLIGSIIGAKQLAGLKVRYSKVLRNINFMIKVGFIKKINQHCIELNDKFIPELSEAGQRKGWQNQPPINPDKKPKGKVHIISKSEGVKIKNQN